MTPQLFTLVSTFAFATVTSVALTIAVRRMAPMLGAVARPHADRWHRSVIPLLGGIAVWGGVTAALIGRLDLLARRDLLTVYGVASLLFVVGLVDDFLALKPGTKLTAQIAAACAAVVMLPGPGWAIGPPGVGVLLMIVWIVGITNAFNLLDNMDGVCAGVAVIAAVSYALTMSADFPEGTVYAAALAGAALGFLLFNFQPASIFMGDSGALFIGASFGVLAIVHGGAGQHHISLAVAIPVLVLLLPIFDTVLVTLTRKLSARSASVGGRDHTSHRLVALGFTERGTALILYALAAAGGTAAAAIRFNLPLGVPVALLLLIGLVLLGVGLSTVRVYGGEDFALLKNRKYTPLLVDVTYKRRIFEIILDVGLIAIAYYLAYIFRFDEDLEANRPMFVASLPYVIACQLLASFASGLYRGVWRYISLPDVRTYAQAVVLGTVSSMLALLAIYRFEGYSRGVFAVYAMTIAMLLIGSRLSFRLIGDYGRRSRLDHNPALIYGAGDAGVLVVRELVNNAKYGYLPVGFIDDDPSRARRRILGIRVLGTCEQVESLIRQHRPRVIILSSEKIRPDRVAYIRDLAAARGIECLQFHFKLVVLKPPASARAG